MEVPVHELLKDPARIFKEEAALRCAVVVLRTHYEKSAKSRRQARQAEHFAKTLNTRAAELFDSQAAHFLLSRQLSGIEDPGWGMFTHLFAQSMALRPRKG